MPNSVKRSKIFEVDFTQGTWNIGTHAGKSIPNVAWLFNGTLPGEVFEACQGDTVTYRVRNDHTMPHGFDPHSLNTDAKQFGDIKPGETRDIRGVADVPGIFMHHCAAGVATDVHIRMGMGSATIVYPNPKMQKMKKAAVELVVIIGATPDGEYYFFNGNINNEPVELPLKKLTRVWIQSVAHGHNTLHVIGSNDTIFFGGWRPDLKNFVNLGQMQGYTLTNGNKVSNETR